MKIVNQTKFLRTLVTHFNYEKHKMFKKFIFRFSFDETKQQC